MLKEIKMNLKFRLKNDECVEIMNEEKVIGHIFTPAGTSHDIENAIQVCGFDDAFDFWGCGVFGDGKGNPKKDIGLLFNSNSTKDDRIADKISLSHGCHKCYNLKENCKCEDLRVKSRPELVAQGISKDYDRSMELR